MLSMSPFQFFLSFCCVFIKFDTKFVRQLCSRFRFSIFVTRHYYTHLHNSLSNQTCWNLNWSSNKNVCLGWCLMCGYSVASCRVTHPVSLLSWRTTYVAWNEISIVFWLYMCLCRMIIRKQWDENRQKIQSNNLCLFTVPRKAVLAESFGRVSQSHRQQPSQCQRHLSRATPINFST